MRVEIRFCLINRFHIAYSRQNPDWKKCGDGKSCSAAIVASKDQFELEGQYSVVYINQGYKHGLERGNLFAIETRMEASGTSGADLPDLVLGYLIIVESRLETATAVVLNAKKGFFQTEQ